MDYYIYILSNADKATYVGVTNDLKRRLYEHRSGTIPGFSKTHRCTSLVYYQHFTDIRYAIAKEKQLKGWRRSKKIELIELHNPHWEDLAEPIYHPSTR